MNWAITLVIDEDQPIEPRLSMIVNYILENYHITNCILDDLDATGILGNKLTRKINEYGGNLAIDASDISSLISEDGQIIELDLFLKNAYEFRFIVRDGYFVIVLGMGERLPQEITGVFEEADVSNYN